MFALALKILIAGALIWVFLAFLFWGKPQKSQKSQKMKKEPMEGENGKQSEGEVG